MEAVMNSTVAETTACTSQPSQEESQFEVCTHVEMDVDIEPTTVFGDGWTSADEAGVVGVSPDATECVAPDVPKVEVGVSGARTGTRPRSTRRTRGVQAHTDAGEGVGGRGRTPPKKKRKRNQRVLSR